MYGRGMGVIERGESPLVTGTPQQTARLRPLRNPLYDTLKYPVGVATRQNEGFTNKRNFTDGTAKDERYTNMTSDGNLGVPLNLAA